MKTLSPNRPLPLNSFFFRPKKVSIIKTKSATIVFSLLLLSLSLLLLFLLSFSFVGVILELIGLKKPAFWQLFTQMTADFVRLVLKKSARYIYIYISNKMRYFSYPILPYVQVVIWCLKDWYLMAWARKTTDISRRHPTGFQAKWHLSNERRNSILLTRHYQDLDSASDWLKIYFIQSDALPRSW